MYISSMRDDIKKCTLKLCRNNWDVIKSLLDDIIGEIEANNELGAHGWLTEEFLDFFGWYSP